MKSMLLLLAVIGLMMAAGPLGAQPGPAKKQKIFPFDYFLDDLDNGLRVVTVPLPYPDLVAFYAVVRAGSRNEVEPGKSGFAHFFEHMMFRGTEKYSPEEYNEVLKAMGADHNAFTTDDFTAYHMVLGKQDLEKAMEVESDRFQHLKYPVDAFRTEAKAVLGEYNKNSANPISKIFEVMREKSFAKHTYKHTTMGFLKDIEDMPNQFAYSKTFFDRFYRPENVVLIVAGDVRRDQVVALAKKYWGAWRRGGFTQQIPVEPEPAGPHTAQVDWESPTLPWVVVGYRGPAFSDTQPDMAALDLAEQVAFSESSPLYKKLVIDEQKVDALLSFFPSSRDPGLLFVGARVKDIADLDGVRADILATVEELKSAPVSQARLDEVRANLRYSFALAMDNTESVARSLAQFIQLDPTPEVVNKTYALYDALSPEQIQRMCVTYLTDQRRTIATLTGPGQARGGEAGAAAGSAVAGSRAGGAAGASAAGAAGAGPTIEKVLRPAQVPLVSVRVLFNVGAASDPKGKEGVAALTAAMLSSGGSRLMPYDQIIEAMYPMAASVSSQVDKEMTVFLGTTHADNLDAYYELLSSMLLDPGWRQDDFERVRDDAVNFLKVNLRGNNDEELGKEALYLSLYGPEHPYGHHTTGTVASLGKLTLEDVRAFYRQHYTRANLVLGLAGGYPEAFVGRVESDFGRLPEGSRSAAAPAEAKPVTGQHLSIIRKDTRATAISIGHPIPVTRSGKDWAALWLAASYLGQHRSSNSHLYQRMREQRGLNYGDYAYVEYFPRGMFLMQPESNLGRQRQIFQIWIRPVEPANGHFALRIALYELKKLIESGMSPEDFEQTRKFLDKFVPLMAKAQGARLGYALDAHYYRTEDFVPWVRKQLASLTLDDVNRAIKANLSWENLSIVAVTKDADGLRQAILSNTPSPITYNAPKPKEITDEDRVIEKLQLSVKPENARVIDVEKVFED